MYSAFRTDGVMDFLFTAFGYAVESVAGQSIRSMSLGNGLTIALQATRGATRPDIVVKHGGHDIAWFDITSSESQGHHLLKESKGWTTTPNVAESTYPALVPLRTLAAPRDLRDRRLAPQDAEHDPLLLRRTEHRGTRHPHPP